MTIAPALFCAPVAGLVPVNVDIANGLVERWGHNLGPSNRPFRQEGWILDLLGEPVAVAISATTVSARVIGPDAVYYRDQLVELSRLCAAPGYPWANRVMLRLWREVAAPMFTGSPRWKVKAAVSYSDGHHTGDLYRFDGWKLWSSNCRSGGGGSWSTVRTTKHPAGTKKKCWSWLYEETAQ